jgi:dolichol-phosphate mannosyltransferase
MINILLPAYNEALNLPSIFEEISKKGFKDNCSVVIVNDGSTDDTKTILAEFRDKIPLKTLMHSENQGLGAALNTGLSFINKTITDSDCVVTLDADSTHSITYIRDMKEAIDHGYDVVIASRYCAGGGQKGLSYLRRVLSKTASLILRVLFPVADVRDYTSGFRMYSGRTIRSLYARYENNVIEEKGFASTLELLLKTRKLTQRIREIPLMLDYGKKKGVSKMNISYTVYRYMALILRTI